MLIYAYYNVFNSLMYYGIGKVFNIVIYDYMSV